MPLVWGTNTKRLRFMEVAALVKVKFYVSLCGMILESLYIEGLFMFI